MPAVAGAKERPEAGRRAEILKVATRMFAQRGFHHTSLQDIAEALKIQKASLYYYFDSKEEILSAILQRGVEELLVDAEKAVQAVDDPREQLDRLLDAHVRNLERRLDDIKVFLSERRSLTPAQERRYLEWRRRYEDLYVQVITEGQARGVFGEGRPRVLAYGILGTYNWLIQWYRPRGELSVRQIHQDLSRLVLRGLLKG